MTALAAGCRQHVPAAVPVARRRQWRLDHDNLHLCDKHHQGGGVHGGPGAHHITCVCESRLPRATVTARGAGSQTLLTAHPTVPLLGFSIGMYRGVASLTVRLCAECRRAG